MIKEELIHENGSNFIYINEDKKNSDINSKLSNKMNKIDKNNKVENEEKKKDNKKSKNKSRGRSKKKNINNKLINEFFCKKEK